MAKERQEHQLREAIARTVLHELFPVITPENPLEQIGSCCMVGAFRSVLDFNLSPCMCLARCAQGVRRTRVVRAHFPGTAKGCSRSVR